MGHIQLGYLPSSVRWQHVATLLRSDQPAAPEVADACLHAAERRLRQLRGDPSLTNCFWLLTRLASAARGPDFAADVARLGLPVTTGDTMLTLLAHVTERARAELAAYPASGPFGELAALALRRALTDALGSQQTDLFASSVDDLAAAFRQHSTPVQFGGLARAFFGDFIARTLRYYLERDLPNAVGSAGLPKLNEANAFASTLDRHARETARIVEGFGAAWFSKHHWESDGAISREEARGFVAHALTKLRRELRAGAV
jgi:hypothetical protein